MELVYLWVEDYKNIHRQGFNFSPRFKCEFKAVYKKDENGNEVLDEEESELTICDKKEKECKDNDYIENFFDTNINVTAIVGKNGSGKSSLLESIFTRNEKNKFIFYNGLIVKNSFQNIKSNNSIDIITLDKLFFINTTKYRYYNNKYNDKFKDYSKDNLYSYDKYLNKITKLILTTENHYNSIFNPKNIIISSLLLPNSFSLSDHFLNIKNHNNIEERFKIYMYAYNRLNQYNNETIIKEIQDKLNNNIDDSNLYLRYKYIDIIEFLNFLFENDIETKKEVKDFYTKYLQNKNYQKIFFYLIEIGFLSYELKNNNEFSYSSLSSGEKFLYADLLILNKEIKSNNKSNILILLEEPDITYHPQWQKVYIKNILEILNKYKNKKFHLIFTTHSPFLISDIPNQNIIFLDTYKATDTEVKNGTQKAGNCKVVDGLKEKKETFGANIHTLLSDSFFMEDGLMGEFAKSKIDEVIKLLNKEQLEPKEIKHCEQIISIIGEPIIKNQLQKMLDNKRLSKIDLIEEKIKNMTYELEILKKHQAKIVKEELQNKGKKQYKERFNNDKNKQ